MLSLPWRRDSETYNGWKHRGCRGIRKMVERDLRRRLLPGAATPQGHHPQRQPGSLPDAAESERRTSAHGRQIRNQGNSHERRAFCERDRRRRPRATDLRKHQQAHHRREPHALQQAGMAEDHGGDEHGVCRRAPGTGQHHRNRRQSRDLRHRSRPDHALLRHPRGIRHRRRIPQQDNARGTFQRIYPRRERQRGAQRGGGQQKKSRNSAATRSCTA